jgi:hypothetical protein
MDEQGFKVNFLGDSSDLEDASKDAAKALGTVSKEATTTAASLGKVPVVSERVSKAAKDMARAAETAGGAAKKSTTNFTGLTRVIQDLPFGFIAISNNLEQLLPAAGGLGLAFSAVVAGLSFAQTGLSNWTRGLGSSVKSIEDNKKALKEFVDSLDDVNKAHVEGAQNAQQDLVQLQTLYTATQNVNIPLAERKKLVDQLQDQYPKYFGNIKDEIILAGGARNAYNQLTVSILAAARARAAQDALVDVQKQVLAIEQEQLNTNQELFDSQTKLDKARAKHLSSGQGSTNVGNLQDVERLTAISSAENNHNKLLQKGVDLQHQRLDLLDRAKRLTDDITDTVQKHPESLTDPGGAAAKVTQPKIDVNFFDKFFSFDPTKVKEKSKEAAEAYSTFLQFALKEQDTFVGLTDILKIDTKESALKAATKWWDDFQNGLIRLKDSPVKDVFTPKIDLPQPPDIKIHVHVLPVVITADQQKYADTIKALSETATQAAQDIATQSFTAIGDAFAAAIEGGNIGDVFKGLFGLIGDAIRQLGIHMIAMSDLIQSLKIAIGAFSGPGVLFAGIGLVALGSILKQSFSHVKGFAAGGLVTGPTMGLIGEGIGTSASNPEVIAPLDKLKNFLQPQRDQSQPVLAHEISGDTLRLWIKRSEKSGRLFS